GTAVFLTPTLEGAPPSLVHHFRYNKVLHEEGILVSIVTETAPEVDATQRMTSRPLGAGFWRVEAHYGCMERPDVRWAVTRCCEHRLTARPGDNTVYIRRC